MELVGIEAISRGARKAILCDEARQAIKVIEKNIEKTHTQEQIKLYQMNFEELLKTMIKERLDIVFIDPPYKTDFAYKAVKILLNNDLLEEESVIVIETDQEKRIREQLKTLEIEIMDERKYGRVHLIFLGQKRKG